MKSKTKMTKVDKNVMDWKMDEIMKIYGKNVVGWCMNIVGNIHDDVHDVLGKNIEKKGYMLVVNL